jgi:hypothetical protein
MPTLPFPLARRIDRLARGAHAFHRFAHHPLCDEYAGEVLRVGRRVRLCRGCALAAVGGLAGAAAGLVLAPDPLLAASGLLTAVALASPPMSRRARGSGKLVVRFLPAAFGAFAIAAGLRAGGAAGVLLALAGLAASWVFVALYRRRGPDRSPCAGCPERLAAEPCRGLAPIVRRERAFQRLSGAWLLRRGIG